MENKEIFEIYKKRLNLGITNYSDVTKKSYLKNVEDFIDGLDKSVLDVKRLDIISHLDNINPSSSKYKVICSSISNLFIILMNSPELGDYIEYNPCQGLIRPKTKSKVKVPLEYKTIDILLENCKNTRDVAILTLLSQTGIRVSECIGLTLSQYQDMNDKHAIVLKHTKGDKERIITLNEKVIKAINDYLPNRKNSNCDNLFISNYGNPMSDSCLRKTWKTIARRSGKISNEKIQSMCNHLFRTSYATELGSQGTPVQVIQNILGHSDISTTLIYLKTDENIVLNTMNSVL